jgi:hypothetical protein
MRDFPIPGHMEVLMTLVQSVIRRLTNSLCPREESMAGHMGINGVYLKIREGKHKREHGGAQVESGGRESVFCLSGAFKTYANLWEGENPVIPIQ